MSRASLEIRKSPEREVSRLEAELSGIRRGLEASLDELDRRRREALDVRRHGVALGAAALGLGAGLGLMVARRVRQNRRSRSLIEKGRRLRHALERMVSDPDRVAKEPPPLIPSLLTSAAVAAGTTLAKKIVEQAFGDAAAQARAGQEKEEGRASNPDVRLKD